MPLSSFFVTFFAEKKVGRVEKSDKLRLSNDKRFSVSLTLRIFLHPLFANQDSGKTNSNSNFYRTKCLNLSHENFSILYNRFLVHRDIHSHWFTFLSRKFVPFNESARISSSPVYLNGAIDFNFI